MNVLRLKRQTYSFLGMEEMPHSSSRKQAGGSACSNSIAQPHLLRRYVIMSEAALLIV